MSDELEGVDQIDPIDQAVEFYSILGPINKEYREVRAERLAALADLGRVDGDLYERWTAIKSKRSEFRTAMREYAAASGTEDPFAAKAEVATVGTQSEEVN